MISALKMQRNGFYRVTSVIKQQTSVIKTSYKQITAA